MMIQQFEALPKKLLLHMSFSSFPAFNTILFRERGSVTFYLTFIFGGL